MSPTTASQSPAQGRRSIPRSSTYRAPGICAASCLPARRLTARSPRRWSTRVGSFGELRPVGERATCEDGGYVLITEELHRVCDDMQRSWEERHARGDYRPLPYATTRCAKRCGLRDPSHASRVIRALI